MADTGSIIEHMRRRLPRIGLHPAIWLRRRMPKGLFARALLIIITPMVLLQSVIAYTFMERHWQTVTQRLSSSLTQDISAIIEMRKLLPDPGKLEELEQIAREKLGLDVDFLPLEPLPPALPKPFFEILDASLSTELRRQLGLPFFIDTVGKSNLIEIRVQLDDSVMRVIARRSQAYASNSHIFLVWMVGTSLILIVIATLFLRNQIRPVLRLADAAESFGKGREVEFRPRGASEVRRAGVAFLEMKRRIERAVEQRTAMLNGVSHDLRTVLTRFKLSLALLDDSPELDDLKRDVDEMSRMLEAYLAFARGGANETAVPTDIRELLEDLRANAERGGHKTVLEIAGDPVVSVRPDAFRRLVTNLVSNAARFGDRICISAVHDERYLTVTVDDDGPGIPEDKRGDVFRPFHRLDEARNQDYAGSGLGLAIVRDIARSHGGDVVLSDSPMGGLRAVARFPA